MLYPGDSRCTVGSGVVADNTTTRNFPESLDSGVSGVDECTPRVLLLLTVIAKILKFFFS